MLRWGEIGSISYFLDFHWEDRPERKSAPSERHLCKTHDKHPTRAPAGRNLSRSRPIMCRPSGATGDTNLAKLHRYRPAGPSKKLHEPASSRTRNVESRRLRRTENEGNRLPKLLFRLPLRGLARAKSVPPERHLCKIHDKYLTRAPAGREEES